MQAKNALSFFTQERGMTEVDGRVKYNPEFHDDWAWSLAIKGATYDELAEAFHVNRRTVIRWMQTHESFAEAFNSGKTIADAKVERSLYKRATGFQIVDTVETVEYDKDGNQRPRKTTTTKTIPPDTMAIMYWLNNRSKGVWAQKQTVEVEAKAVTNDVHIYLPEVEEEQTIPEAVDAEIREIPEKSVCDE